MYCIRVYALSEMLIYHKLIINCCFSVRLPQICWGSQYVANVVNTKPEYLYQFAVFLLFIKQHLKFSAYGSEYSYSYRMTNRALCLLFLYYETIIVLIYLSIIAHV